MDDSEKYAVRAMWQVARDMGLSIDVANELRDRTEAQIDQWHKDDEAERLANGQFEEVAS